ncbi:hypothetical protein JOC85_003000 [Bacillus mesophilus]|uniref:Uncharacterized protein n=1 Tax=Bacillus mesophilus TaxID=1808955 RepID=A0A6M0Q7W5_9BACI|nr:hypothetical protein [Bacillus mesophilus]MBM7662193.1 hypothetical protein [Bacillus mesophilus]NEY72456.1 hypothetical protein [Bacillus mesophilus]
MRNWLKFVILTYLSFIFFGSFLAVGMLFTGYIEERFPFISEIELFLYYFFAGAIGGSLRHLYMFCSHYIKDNLNNYRVWIMYIFYPIFATGTAVIAVTLIQSGILFIEFTNHQEGPYAQIAIAFLIGFGFNRFLDKLNTISSNMFDSRDKGTGTSSQNNQ